MAFSPYDGPNITADISATAVADDPYADLLLGIDPTDLDLDDLDSLSPPRPAANRPPLSALDTDDAPLPSSQPNERASAWLMQPLSAVAGPSRLAVAAAPPPPAGAAMTSSGAYSTSFASAAGLDPSLGLGRPSVPPVQLQGEADAVTFKRRKVSRDSWTAGSPDRDRSDDDDHEKGGPSPYDDERELEDRWGFVQPNLPFGSTQTPAEVTFMTARGTSFAPPSRAALERAAKLLGSVLSDDEDDAPRAGADGVSAAWKGKAKTRVPFGVLEGENGQSPAPNPAPPPAGEQRRRLSLTEPGSTGRSRPPPSATLLPDRRRLGAVAPRQDAIRPPPLLSQATSSTAQPHCQPPHRAPPAPTPTNAPRPLPLPAHLSSTPARRNSPGVTSSASRTPIPLAGASTPNRRVGLSLGTTSRASTPGFSGRAVGTPPSAAGALGIAGGGRSRKPFATPFKKNIGGPSHADEASGTPTAVASREITPVLPPIAPTLRPAAVAPPASSTFAPAGPGGKAISVAGTPLRAGIPGDRAQRSSTSTAPFTAPGAPKALKTDYPRVFDLTPNARRVSMREAFVRPQFFSEEELTLYGVPDEIAAVDLTNASYYFFTPSPSDTVSFAADDAEEDGLSWRVAHATLYRRGCTRLGPPSSATKAGTSDGTATEAGRTWTQNHWELILWKLACLCRARPPMFFRLPTAIDQVDGGDGPRRTTSESESEGEVEGGSGRWRKGLESRVQGERGQGKFGWDEMIRQLLYRYEREFNQGHRSCLQRIHEQDSSPASSMVLCVSNVPDDLAAAATTAASDASKSSRGSSRATTGKAPAVIELTDGWYRIAAEVDEVLAQAIRRGKLHLGAKIGISGARLETTTSGAPPIKAHANKLSHLVLTGNTTSLVRWDTPLGFVPPTSRPFIACLSSLSAEGGPVPLMDIIVDRCFPVGWVDVAGEGEPPGEPRDDKEERAERRRWENKCEDESQAVQDEVSKRLDDLLTLTERVERLVGSTRPSEAGGSADSEDQYEQLADTDDKAAFLRTLDRRETANLASFMRAKYADDLGRVQQEIAEELQLRCPPREVRSFKIIKFRDAQTTRPAQRIGQLCLWDAAQLGEAMLLEGKRYLISNLSPGQRRSWAPAHTAGEIYLNTRRDSKWSEVSG